MQSFSALSCHYLLLALFMIFRLLAHLFFYVLIDPCHPHQQSVLALDSAHTTVSSHTLKKSPEKRTVSAAIALSHIRIGIPCIDGLTHSTLRFQWVRSSRSKRPEATKACRFAYFQAQSVLLWVLVVDLWKDLVSQQMQPLRTRKHRTNAVKFKISIICKRNHVVWHLVGLRTA